MKPTTPLDAAGVAPPDAPLDSLEALKAAQAAGLKATLIVPHAVRCPVVPPPTGDPRRLAATGALAGLAIDIEGFLRDDVGVPEAVALLGAPALCSRAPGSGYMTLHLAPRAPNVQEATLETHDGDLIGVIVEVAPPVDVDIAALSERYGPARSMPGLHGPSGDVLDPKTAAFHGLLMFRRHGHADPITARRIHQIIYRRSPTIEMLPEKFLTAEDLARLVKLALRSRAPETVSFNGTLGVFDKITGDQVSFHPAEAMRNVAVASIDKRTVGGRHFLRSMRVTFGTPVATDAPTLATTIGAALGTSARAVTTGSAVRIEVPAGTIRVESANGGVSTIAIDRAPLA